MGADVVLGEAQFLGVVERVDEESVRVRAQGGDQGEVPQEIFVDLHKLAAAILLRNATESLFETVSANCMLGPRT